jgi:hypothetical protein
LREYAFSTNSTSGIWKRHIAFASTIGSGCLRGSLCSPTGLAYSLLLLMRMRHPP